MSVKKREIKKEKNKKGRENQRFLGAKVLIHYSLVYLLFRFSFFSGEVEKDQVHASV